MHDLLVVRQNQRRTLVSCVHQLTHFLVDLFRSLLAEVAMLIDLATEEDLFIFLAESDRAERTHSEFTDHAASEIRRLLDIIAGTGSHLLQEDLFSNASAHHDGQTSFEIFLRIGVLIIDR